MSGTPADRNGVQERRNLRSHMVSGGFGTRHSPHLPDPSVLGPRHLHRNAQNTRKSAVHQNPSGNSVSSSAVCSGLKACESLCGRLPGGNRLCIYRRIWTSYSLWQRKRLAGSIQQAAWATAYQPPRIPPLHGQHSDQQRHRYPLSFPQTGTY